ncbi:MAG TPA: hypothetical protein PK668_01610 [Myxococcota bacterium]|nr:hypothetical protein [Myxococcota bacterium]HRY94736.1 hypothetical protein [Myxococcota bacterium]HSA20041.1 hypothetical protein [Myxococcota bacterium]
MQDGTELIPADDPLAALATLPARDVDTWRAEQIRRLAQAALAEAARPARRPFDRFSRLVLEPTFMLASSAATLVISFQAAISLLVG